MTDHTDSLISRRAVVSIVTGFVVIIVLAVLTSPIGRSSSAPTGMDQGTTTGLPASTAPPAPGETGLGDSLFPELGNSGYDVQHYDLDLRWNPEGDQLSGTATIDLTATAQLSSFSLDLSGLVAGSVTVAGVDATFLAESEELIITPTKPLDKGIGVQVVIAYSGSPSPRQSPFDADIGWMPSADGVIIASEPDGSHGWFPCNDHPSDKATFRISMSVPAGLMVVGNGELESHTSDAAGSTWVWHEDSPMAPYLATANIGKFDIAEGETTAGVPIYVAVDPKTDVDPKQQVALIKKVIDFQVGVFGPYPFDSVGGIYEYGNLGYALETQTKPIYPSDVLDDSIVVHELAHQWFGDSVSVQDWRDIWLNEGFATYAEWMYTTDNDVEAITTIFDKLYDRGPGFWRRPPGSPTVEGMFDGPVYLRGAMTVHAIRLTIGESAFANLLKAWTSTYADGNATTTDLFELTKTLSDVPTGKLFESWLYTPGRPQHP